MEGTRRAIVANSLRLVEEAGSIDDVSIDAIAAATGISRRTFFNYFPGKMTPLLLPLFEFRSYSIQGILDEDSGATGFDLLQRGVESGLMNTADVELVAAAEWVLATLVHRSVGGEVPDSSADEAHTMSLLQALEIRHPSYDEVSLGLMVAMFDQAIRLTLRQVRKGTDANEAIAHTFSSIRQLWSTDGNQ